MVLLFLLLCGQEAEEAAEIDEFAEEEAEAEAEAEEKAAARLSRTSVGSLEDMEEETRSRRGTFSGEGQLLNFEDEPSIEGFVMMKGRLY